MSEQVMLRVPERAALRIQAAVQVAQHAQTTAQAVVDAVMAALDVPAGWQLAGDGAGLYFAPVGGPETPDALRATAD